MGRSEPILQAVEAFNITASATAIGTARSEVRTLTVTTKSTTAENITITLDGDALATVAVTDQTAGTTSSTATEIAAADYSGVGTGWTAVAVAATVVFTSLDTLDSHTGTYTLSSASTAVGTFAQTTVGQNNVKAAPNVAIFVGTGGDLDVQVGQNRLTFKNLSDGTFVPVLVSHLYSTATTASDLIAISDGGR